VQVRILQKPKGLDELLSGSETVMPEDFPQIIADALIQYQSLGLIVMALGFAALEPILPHHPIERRRDLLLDVIGVVAGVAFVAMSYAALRWLASLLAEVSWARQ
jgi:hypothetical protein